MTENWTPATIEVVGHCVAALMRGTDRRLPPVIFIHGIAASVDLWPAVLHTTCGRFRCCSLSLPGHATSFATDTLGPNDVTCELFADIVIAAAGKFFAGESPHLVGWSTGGFAALAAAAKQPGRFASVSSICGFARGRWGDLMGLLQWLAALDWCPPLFHWNLVQVGRSPWLLDRILHRICGKHAISYKHNAASHEAVQSAWNSLHEAARRHDPRLLTTLLRGIRELDLTPQLCRITTPTQIIGGTVDSVVRPAEAIHLANGIKSSKLVTIPECGHMFFADARERILDLAFSWVHEHHHNVSQETAPVMS